MYHCINVDAVVEMTEINQNLHITTIITHDFWGKQFNVIRF